MGKDVKNTINQGMLYDRVVSSDVAKTFGESHKNRVRSAFSNHENSVVRDNPTFTFDDGSLSEGEGHPLTSHKLKKEFMEFIKRGQKNIAGSVFASGEADLSYSNAPDTAVAPEFILAADQENLPGGTGTPRVGSTIVASGRGPNVNVQPDTLLEREVVDATPESSPDEHVKPSETSSSNLINPPPDIGGG